MEVLDANVDWLEDYANDPRLQVLVDEVPARESMRFEKGQNGLWYAEQDGFARYYSWGGPGNEGGFSGRHIELTTVDGEAVTLKGPWSARAGVVNKAGFGPVVDVSLTTEPEVLKSGGTFRSASLTLLTAKQAVDLAPEASHLERKLKFEADEPYWVPVRENGGEA